MACDVLKSLVFCVFISCFSSLFQPAFCDEYSRLFFENDEVCSYAFKPKNILIGHKDKPALILSEKSYFDSWPGTRPFNCNFHVFVHNQGLFAVIQNMYLRRNATTKECIDYIQFKQSKQQFPINLQFEREQHNWGPKYCGRIIATDIMMEQPDSDIAPNAYIANEGSIAVKIHITPKQVLDNETLTLEIAFTPYSICRYDNNAVKNCGENMCISQKYVTDGVVNCPFIDCRDEGTCVLNFNGTRITKFATGIGVRLSMNAIASVFSVFLVFISCLWLCRHCGAFCFEPPPQPIIVSSPVEMGDVRAQQAATAPPIADDKDLPPSYDSLFPEGR
ncbi:unnamed protein product [Bemisia tabaci]|uniref:Uncharacterized protein n=1 Tax=Bemisia tabaci TaxID=7038 RepID=A0A9P0A2D9_BEMTA|nr:unnamed protein product [Bemisia tabaci]